MTVEMHVGEALIAALTAPSVPIILEARDASLTQGCLARTEYLTIRGRGRRAIGKSTRGAGSPTSGIWTTPPDATSVHAKPLRSRQLSAFRIERRNLARSVHFQSPSANALRYA